jgi:hypothetical protein
MTVCKHPFDSWLSVGVEYLDGVLENPPSLPWLDFWLNPRRLRGSDFLMRWSQGVGSEKRIIEAVNQTKEFFAIPYGPSGTAPSSSVREFELYFERLEAVGLGKIKRPDLLIFSGADRVALEHEIGLLGGNSELPFIHEDDMRIAAILNEHWSLWSVKTVCGAAKGCLILKRLCARRSALVVRMDLKKGPFCQPSL